MLLSHVGNPPEACEVISEMKIRHVTAKFAEL